MADTNGDVEAPTTTTKKAENATSTSNKKTPDDAKEASQTKKLPKWVPAVVAVVLVAVTLSAIIPAAIYSARKESTNDDKFEARSGELAQAEPLQGAEWVTASFTPAPPAPSVADSDKRPGLAHGFVSDNQNTPTKCATSVVDSRRYGVPVCRSIVGVNENLCPEGYYKDYNGDCVYSFSFG